MSSSVLTNISSLNSQSELHKTEIGLLTTLARLTEAVRIRNSAEDAAKAAITSYNILNQSGLAALARAKTVISFERGL